MANYSSDRASAYADIKEAGMAMTLQLAVPGNFDDVAGTETGAGTLDYECYGIVTEYKASAINGATILLGDKNILLSAAADFPDPAANNLLLIDSVAHIVVDCKPFAPAGMAIFYKVQVRK